MWRTARTISYCNSKCDFKKVTVKGELEMNKLKNWFSKQKLGVRALLVTLLMFLGIIAFMIPPVIGAVIAGNPGAFFGSLISAIISVFLVNYYCLKGDDEINEYKKKLH